MNLPKKIGLTLGLALLAVLGNYFHLSLFFGLDLIFGSIAVMVALVLLGRVSGVLVALAGGAWTVLLWGHPYALVLFVLEALAVGWLLRRVTYLALADALFWLFAGGPLAVLFFGTALGLDWNATIMITLKLMVNGILNAMLASFLVKGWRALKPGPAGQGAQGISVGGLMFNAFLAIGLMVGLASIVMYSYNSARDLYMDVGAGLDSTARRVVRYLERENVSPQQAIDAVALDDDINLALLAPAGDVLAQRGELRSRQPGSFEDLEAYRGLRIWLPEGQMALVARWRRGYYILELPAVGHAGNRLVIERAAAPSVVRIERGRLDLLGLMAMVAVLSVAVAWLLSRWLTQPIVEIERLSRSLPERIMAGQSEFIPGSRVAEFNGLRRSLQVMADTMARSFQAAHDARASLEQQVQERTQTLVQREQSLRQSRQLLDSIIEHIPAMVFVKRAQDLRFELLNRAGEKLLGYSRQDLLGKSDYDFFPRAQAEAFVRRDREVLASGEVHVIAEEPVTTADGQTRYLHTLKIGLRDDNGAPAHLLGISLDITERRESEFKLLKSEQRLQLALRAARSSLWDANPVTGHIVLDTHWAELIGQAPREMEITFQELAQLVPPQEQIDVMQKMMATIRGERNEYQAEHRVRHQQGHWIWIESRGRVVERDAAGRALRMIGTNTDITERKRLDQMKNEFVSTVSHELRTPLTTIAGALGLATGGALGELPAQAYQVLEMAYRNSQRLGHLIDDLLDMEKLVAGKMSFDLQVQPLMPLVEHAVASTRAYGEQHQVHFVLTERADDVQAQVDGGRLEQVLANFLSNAAKFSPPGGQVEVAVHPLPGRVRVSVTDHGPGVPIAFRPRLFQKFSQADGSNTRSKSGTGLGLAISKELIEHMNGEVGFESEEGRGACFYFELPLVARSS